MHQSENIKIKLITIINKDEYSWLILQYANPKKMKKIRQTLWEKNHFKFWLMFSRLRDDVKTCYSILLELAQIVCIIIDIDRIENKGNLSNSFGDRDI